jgi:hypothetical protein
MVWQSDFFELLGFTICLQLFTSFDGKALMSKEAEVEKRHSAREKQKFSQS